MPCTDGPQKFAIRITHNDFKVHGPACVEYLLLVVNAIRVLTASWSSSNSSEMYQNSWEAASNELLPLESYVHHIGYLCPTGKSHSCYSVRRGERGVDEGVD